jgi:hypothetical protein
LKIDLARVAKTSSKSIIVPPTGRSSISSSDSSWTTGIITEIGSGGAWVDMPASNPQANQWGPTDGTLFAVGAVVLIQLNAAGVITKIGPAISLGDDAEVIPTGAPGQAILDAQGRAEAAQAGVNETQQAIDEAKAELEENQQQLADNLAAADQRLTDAAQEASEKYALLDQTRQDVEQVRDTAQGAADLAAQTAEVAIISVVTEYAVGSSDTTAPTSGWSTSTPARTPGTFIWSRAITTKGDGTQSTSSPVLVTGNTGAPGATGAAGADGRGVQSTTVTYQAASSGTTVPTGSWSSSIPTVAAGQYLWTRTVLTYTDATTTTSYSIGRMGEQGVKGDTGSTGAGVSSVTTFYALVGQGVAAPAKPTVNPPAAPWSLTEPAYTSNTELYRVDLTVLSSGSWSYGAVSKVSAYTAATQAKGVANQALTAANLAQASARGLIKASQTDPGHAVGRIWFVLNATGNVIGMKISNGSAWSSYAIIAEDLMVVGSDGTVRLKNGVVTGTNLVFDNAFVTGLMATDAFLTSLWSSKVTVSGENLWKNQRFDPLGPVIGAVSDQTPPVGNARLCNDRDHFNSAGAFDVTPGDRLVVEVTAKRTAGARALRGGLWWTGTSGNGWDGFADFGDVGVVSGDWHRYRRTITVPADKSRATLYIQIDQSASTGFDTTWHVADAAIRRAVGGELIVDGAVTAAKMTVTQELWAKLAVFAKVTTDMLIAGDATITNELLVDTLTGKIIRGGLLSAGTKGTTPYIYIGGVSDTVGEYTVDDEYGVYVTTPGSANTVSSGKLFVNPTGVTLDLTQHNSDSEASFVRAYATGLVTLGNAADDITLSATHVASAEHGNVSWARIIAATAPPLGQIITESTSNMAANAWKDMPWGSASADLEGGMTWDGSAFTVPIDGWYDITGSGYISAANNSTARRGVGIAIGSADPRYQYQYLCAGSPGAYTAVSVAAQIHLTAGQKVRLCGRHEITGYTVPIGRAAFAISLKRQG